MLERLPVEGIQRIEIMPRQRFGGHDQHQHQHEPAEEPPDGKQRRKDQQHHTGELECVTQFKARLCKIGNRHKGNVHQHLRHQPVGPHRKISQDQRPQHTEGVAQHIRRIQ